MVQYREQWDRQRSPHMMSGRVLLAGTGFLVSSTIWALLAFVQDVDGNGMLTLLNVSLVIAHFIVGAMVLKRIRASWALGLALAVVSLAACVINDYYLAVIADGVSGLLLFFSRAEITQRGTATGDGE